MKPENGDSTTPADGQVPDPALFWRWAARASRPAVGWILIAVGVLALLLGYLGVSRQALVAKQIPYLVSGGIPGMVLVAIGAFFVATEDLRRELQRIEVLEEKVAQLHSALLRPTGDPAPEIARNGDTPTGETLVAIARGSHYHRADCPMAKGKAGAGAVSAAVVARRKLSPCPMCAPAGVEA
ncbi:MAG: hypothetical protein WDA27_02400 [Actinomycetota bacterium]